LPNRNKTQRSQRPASQNTLSATDLSGMISRYPFLFSCTAVLILFAVVLTVFVPTYMTNDDPGMASIAAGIGKAQQPDEHLRYTNVIIGFVLKTLYTVLPYFPWYAAFHILVQYLSMVFLLYALIIRGFSWTRLLFFLIYFAGIEVFFITNLQFTITAILAGQTGIILFLSALEDSRSRCSWIMLFISILLILISCMIRRKGCYLVSLLSIPVLLVTFVETIKRIPEKRLLIKKYVVFITVAAVLAATAVQFNRMYYNTNPEWKRFYTINALKGQFIDYNRASYTNDTKYIFDEVGWSYNDFKMLMTWFFADTEVFSTDKMENVLSVFPPHKPVSDPLAVLKTLKNVLADSYVLCILFVLFAFHIDFRRRQDLLKAFLTFFAVVITAYLMILFLKLPARVYLPMFSFSAALALFLADRKIAFKHNVLNIIGLVVLVIALCTLPVTLGEQYKNGKAISLKNRYLKEELLKINPQKDQLFYTWGHVFPHQYVLPFDTVEYLSNFKLIGISSILHTPFTTRRMEEFDIEDLYTGLYEKDTIFLIAYPSYLPNYIQYVQEHYGVDVQAEIHYTSYTFGFAIYKIRKIRG